MQSPHRDMDPLVLLPVEEWPRLRDSFKNHWPFGISGYCLLDTQIRFHELQLDCPFQVYCPYGKIEYGMVAKIQKKKLHEVLIMANSEDTSKLEQSLLNTSLIDWSKSRTEVPYVPPGTTRKMLDKVYPLLGLKLVMEGPGFMHVFDRKMKPYADVLCPEGTYVAAVRQEHVTQVDRVWPHRYPSSDWFFSLLIQAGQSYGLFSRTDRSLVAWMFINEAGFLCHLYCEEDHRRKGYAEYMVKHVTNDQIRRGKDVFCYIVKGNEKSLQLFSKMGYKNMGNCSWMYFEKI